MLFSASWCATLKRREGLVTRPPTLLHVPLLRASLTIKASKVASTDTIHIISVPSQTIYIWRLCKGMLHAMGRSLGCKSSSHYAWPLAASPGVVTLYQVPMQLSSTYPTRCIRHAGWDTVLEVDELGRCHCSKWRTLSSTIML